MSDMNNTSNNSEGVAPQSQSQSGIPFGLTELLTKEGLKSAEEVLAGKTTLGFYFSAHWCPPCRQFTPILDAFYKTTGISESEMEIIFVSSDQDQAAFDEYYNEMSWTALPHAQREKKNELSEFFGVSGIPAFIITDMNGLVKTDQGRGDVMNPIRDVMMARMEAVGKDNFKEEDAKLEFNETEAAPMIVALNEWIAMEGKEPPEFYGIETVTDGETDFSMAELRENNKAFAFYFSASWCPPCRGFSPLLKKLYENTRNTATEIIFVGLDRTEAEHNEYFAKMPWKAVKYDDAEDLARAFKIRSIPHMAVTDSSGKVVASGQSLINAVKEATSDDANPEAMQALMVEWESKCE